MRSTIQNKQFFTSHSSYSITKGSFYSMVVYLLENNSKTKYKYLSKPGDFKLEAHIRNHRGRLSHTVEQQKQCFTFLFHSVLNPVRKVVKTSDIIFRVVFWLTILSCRYYFSFKSCILLLEVLLPCLLLLLICWTLIRHFMYFHLWPAHSHTGFKSATNPPHQYLIFLERTVIEAFHTKPCETETPHCVIV